MVIIPDISWTNSTFSRTVKMDLCFGGIGASEEQETSEELEKKYK